MRFTAAAAAAVLALGLTGLAQQADATPPPGATDASRSTHSYAASSVTLPTPGGWATGWSAVVTDGATAASRQLAVIGKAGERWPVATVGADAWVVDVRHDARAVITATGAADAPQVFKVWDVGARTSIQVTLPSGSEMYFGPGGELLTRESYPVGRFTVRARNGAYERTLSIPVGVHSAASTGGTALFVARGSDLIVHDVVTDKTRLSAPYQEPVVDCWPHGMWSDGQMTFGCWDIPGTGTFHKAAGPGRATRLAASVSDATSAYATTPVAAQANYAPYGCGSGGIALVVDGKPQWIRPEGPWVDGSNLPMSAHAGSGTSLWMRVTWSCDDDEKRVSLVRFDTQSRRTTVLAGPGSPADQRPVRSAATVDNLT